MSHVAFWKAAASSCRASWIVVIVALRLKHAGRNTSVASYEFFL
jgi:hypothetical protein